VSGPLDFDERPAEQPPERRAEAPPPGRPPSSRYTWFLGVVAVLLIALVMVNALRSEGVTTGGPQADDRLAPFAVPLAEAASREDEDANVNVERACHVRGEGILNICEEAERGPVVLALFPTRAGQCRGVLGQLERLAPRFEGVSFLAVGSGGDRETIAGAREVRVGWDRDNAVASVYGLAGCPQVTFARGGGWVVETTHRELTDEEIAERVRRLR
jgi:hypothetical protein